VHPKIVVSADSGEALAKRIQAKRRPTNALRGLMRRDGDQAPSGVRRSHPFRSGDVDLDRFLERYAGQNQFRHHVGTTYVAVETGRIIGYVTVAPGQRRLLAPACPDRCSAP
jgi:hypothetical protein